MAKDWSFSFSISPSSEHSGLTSLGLTGWISCSLRDSQESSPTPQFKSISASVLSFFYIPTLASIHDNWKKNIGLTRQTFVGKVISLLLNILSRLVITFLSRSKRLLISLLQSSSAVSLEPKKAVCHRFHCFPNYLPWSHRTGCYDLSFSNVEF